MKTYINKRLNYTAEVNGESAQVKFTDNGKEVTNAFPAELVIGSPEWELKPSWQILSFKDEEGDIWSLTENGCYAYGKDYASFTLKDYQTYKNSL